MMVRISITSLPLSQVEGHMSACLTENLIHPFIYRPPAWHHWQCWGMLRESQGITCFGIVIITVPVIVYLFYVFLSKRCLQKML